MYGKRDWAGIPRFHEVCNGGTRKVPRCRVKSKTNQSTDPNDSNLLNMVLEAFGLLVGILLGHVGRW